MKLIKRFLFVISLVVFNFLAVQSPTKVNAEIIPLDYTTIMQQNIIYWDTSEGSNEILMLEDGFYIVKVNGLPQRVPIWAVRENNDVRDYERGRYSPCFQRILEGEHIFYILTQNI